jgi:hypothetical protein
MKSYNFLLQTGHIVNIYFHIVYFTRVKVKPSVISLQLLTRSVWFLLVCSIYLFSTSNFLGSSIIWFSLVKEVISTWNKRQTHRAVVWTKYVKALMKHAKLNEIWMQKSWKIWCKFKCISCLTVYVCKIM